MVYWITGRKGSGKTTLAKKLAAQIKNSVVLDGDELRARTKNYDFTDQGRLLNQTRLTKLAVDHEALGQVPIIACVSPNKKVRAALQAKFRMCVEIQLPFGTVWEGTTYEE